AEIAVELDEVAGETAVEEEFVDGFELLVRGQQEDIVFVFELGSGPADGRNLADAGGTPGGPVVHEYLLARIFAELERLAGKCLELARSGIGGGGSGRGVGDRYRGSSTRVGGRRHRV